MGTPRSIIVEPRQANRTLLEIVQSAFRIPRKDAINALRDRHVKVCGGVCLDPQRRVKAGQHIQLDAKSSKPKPSVNAQGIVVRYLDEHIVVVEKPAGLTTVRHARDVGSLGKRAKKFLPP